MFAYQWINCRYAQLGLKELAQNLETLSLANFSDILNPINW